MKSNGHSEPEWVGLLENRKAKTKTHIQINIGLFLNYEHYSMPFL